MYMYRYSVTDTSSAPLTVSVGNFLYVAETAEKIFLKFFSKNY